MDGVTLVGIGVLIMIASLVGAVITGAGFEWFSLLLIGYTVTVTFFMKKGYNRFRSKQLKILLNIIVWVIMLVAGSFIIVQGLIASAGKWHQDYSSDYLLVPGAGIIRKAPSFTLAGRLDTAIRYMLNNPGAKVIVSGGLSDGQMASEAQVMAWYLEKNNISSDRIILEENASNTMENILFSKNRVEELYQVPLNELIIITSDYHLLRAQMIAKRIGIKADGIKTTSTPGLYKQYATREYFAVFKSLLMDWPY